MPSAINLFGHDFLVTFKKGGTSCNDRPCLILTGPDLSGGGSGSGGSGGAIPYYGYLDEKCSGCDYLVFAFGDERLCSAARTLGCGCTNLLKLKVSRVICGWAGVGWYCVRTAGTTDGCAVAELLDADKCDDTIEICSGPYATEADAITYCVSPGNSCLNAAPARVGFETSYTATSSGTYWWKVSVTNDNPYHIDIAIDPPGSGIPMNGYHLCDVDMSNVDPFFSTSTNQCINFTQLSGSGTEIFVSAGLDPGQTFTFKVSEGACP